VTDLYLVRVLLVRVPIGKRAEVMIQNSVECADEKAATALFKDLLREMPQSEVKR